MKSGKSAASVILDFFFDEASCNCVGISTVDRITSSTVRLNFPGWAVSRNTPGIPFSLGLPFGLLNILYHLLAVGLGIFVAVTRLR